MTYAINNNTSARTISWPFRLRTLTAAVAYASALGIGSVALTAHASEVTWDDILNDHNTTETVLMYGMGVKAQRYSPLDQINADNVEMLTPAWSHSFGDEMQRGQESQALIHEGVIYVTGSYSRIFAIDARTGKRLWSYNHRLPSDIRPCCDVVNRGAAIYGDKVFFGTLDAGIVALNKDTGEVVWRERFGDHRAGYTMTGAPTIVEDSETGRVLLIHGSSGDEFGIVGKLYARDPDTGEEIWMRPFVEGHMGRLNGEEGTPTGDASAPSWPDDPDSETGKVQAWSQGGGAPWQSASFDPDTNTIIIGAGNPAPWNGWARTSEDGDPSDYDSLYTSGQLGIDPSTGEVKWFYQHTPNDTWDFSGNNEIVLFEYEDENGQTVNAGAHADRNGFFYVTDRTNGELINAFPFVDNITWATHIDLETGRPVEAEGQRPPRLEEGQTRSEPVEVSPPFLGGKNWNPMAYSEDTGLFYVPGNHWKEDYWTEEVEYVEGAAYLGMGFRIKRMYDDHVGILRAIDPVTGEYAWEHKEPMPLWAGVLATHGDLVFTGTGDGYFKAFHAETGEELWKFQVGTGIISPPVTWEMDGEQYIGVTAGYGGAVPLWGGDMAELTRPIAQGGSFWVFKLPSFVKELANR
ncbi:MULTISPECIES: methanol/ethanol family PQQ-dependent dehydrogenase [Halomonadaceae]|uniref:methanol/ethanol family PQQ-dependent dehydrogenase n=1 Tax=Halomonadaceae TaxID=28256 RepID=UPI00059AF05A|nr:MULTISPECIES: methanol/ethanol family PQQ-dependent dehydrogenase [Halomonas]UEQ03687.1 methanol/ethanol family PQQ-dependent dehydrogenase [Halomonas profundus]KIN13595.1 quinonprotein alcohol dehydrogenase [Halomonas sp. KHS3]CAD5260434.1 Quinoprotein alcohol dehydrogenase (cytochrome c) [Halomonas sp. 59]CAD5260736.1 Quinoprotein alcohol dehydrogenase (cytochrome c) [Halomonas sp. 113]CAD5274701.1 Quinoprotein alcohol dehydrogenase (cytochrome c) [Halomonas sp. I3]